METDDYIMPQDDTQRCLGDCGKTFLDQNYVKTGRLTKIQIGPRRIGFLKSEVEAVIAELAAEAKARAAVKAAAKAAEQAAAGNDRPKPLAAWPVAQVRRGKKKAAASADDTAPHPKPQKRYRPGAAK